jgi:hypothetical protein
LHSHLLPCILPVSRNLPSSPGIGSSSINDGAFEFSFLARRFLFASTVQIGPEPHPPYTQFIPGLLWGKSAESWSRTLLLFLSLGRFELIVYTPVHLDNVSLLLFSLSLDTGCGLVSGIARSA